MAAMKSSLATVPNYRKHKVSGQAVVTISGRDIYLGRHNTPESRERYDRAVAEWLANGRCLPPSSDRGEKLTINELILAYWGYITTRYVRDGRPTLEQNKTQLVLRELRKLYGSLKAGEFGPLRLKTVRSTQERKGHGRRYLNDQIARIVRMFRWGVENELVPAACLYGLQSVRGLRVGECSTPDPEPIRPVSREDVDAVKPHISDAVAAMIELQWLTGMRPGEVLTMRACDLDMSRSVWSYRPQRHKTERFGIQREIFLGQRGQAVLRPFLDPDITEYLFSPAKVIAEINRQRRSSRRSPMTPSQRRRRPRRNPKRTPGDHYTRDSYRRAIARACGLAGIKKWSPNQLRHSAATRIRKAYDLDSARVVLGQRSPRITEIYAENDGGKAMRLMAEAG